MIAFAKWSEISIFLEGQQKHGCQVDWICTAYSKLPLLMRFDVGPAASKNPQWMGWAGGYKRAAAVMIKPYVGSW